MARIDVPFVVEKQRITQPTQTELMSGGHNYFYATFTLCDTWEDISSIKAVFCREGDAVLMPLEEGNECLECLIPWEVMTYKGAFEVGIFGDDRLLTNLAYVKVGQGCITEGDEPKPPTPDWFKMVEDLTDKYPIIGENGNWYLWDIESRCYVDSGHSSVGIGKDGQDGKDGKDGKDGQDGCTPQNGIDYNTPEDKEEIKQYIDENIDDKVCNVANALKGNASGGMVTVTDDSPIEHNMLVQLSSDTVTDFSNVKVTACGKNLWDSATEQWGLSTVQSGYYEVPIKVGKGNTISVSYSQSLEMGLGFYTGFALGQEKTISKWIYHSTVKELIVNSLSFVSENDFIYLRTIQPYAKFKEYIGNDLQIEISKTVTEYEPYSVKNYTPNVDGTVDGIKSIYPIMNVFTTTENVTVNVDYNRDINKAVETLTNAIISLGGNV